jgi:hypothetical protein
MKGLARELDAIPTERTAELSRLPDCFALARLIALSDQRVGSSVGGD